MKPADNITILFKNSKITVGPDVDKTILNKATRALPHQAAPPDRPTWRIIMHSKITKPLAAAVVVIAVLTGIYQLTGTFDGASVAWADVAQTTKQQEWIYFYSDNGHNISQWWLCPEKNIKIHDYNGNVTYRDFNSNVTYFYDKNKNEIEKRLTVIRPHDVTFEDEQRNEEIFNRPYEELDRLQHYTANSKTAPEISRGVYRGHNVRIYKYKSDDEELNIGKDGYWLIIYMDAEKKLLRGYVMWSHSYVGPDPDTAEYIGVHRSERAFDYPNPGPRNIYDVGVPKDANVIDRYDEQFIELLPAYNQHRQRGLNKIACIITSYDTNISDVVTQVEMHRNPDGPISRLEEPLGGVAMMFYVYYVDGVNLRREHRFNLLDQLGSRNIIQYWPQCKKELGNSYETQLAWLRDRDDATFSSIAVYDGKNRYSFSKQNGSMSVSPDDESNSSKYGFLWQFTWPVLDVRSEIFEDDYTEQEGLIGVKYIQKGWDNPNEDIFIYYLNPEKDYLCHKQIIEWSNGNKQIHEVEEYQHINGLWYPRKVGFSSQESEHKLEYRGYKKFFIDEHCSFPDTVFDVAYIEQLSEQLK